MPVNLDISGKERMNGWIQFVEAVERSEEMRSGVADELALADPIVTFLHDIGSTTGKQLLLEPDGSLSSKLSE